MNLTSVSKPVAGPNLVKELLSEIVLTCKGKDDSIKKLIKKLGLITMRVSQKTKREYEQSMVVVGHRRMF